MRYSIVMSKFVLDPKVKVKQSIAHLLQSIFTTITITTPVQHCIPTMAQRCIQRRTSVVPTLVQRCMTTQFQRRPGGHNYTGPALFANNGPTLYTTQDQRWHYVIVLSGQLQPATEGCVDCACSGITCIMPKYSTYKCTQTQPVKKHSLIKLALH